MQLEDKGARAAAHHHDGGAVGRLEGCTGVASRSSATKEEKGGNRQRVSSGVRAVLPTCGEHDTRRLFLSLSFSLSLSLSLSFSFSPDFLSPILTLTFPHFYRCSVRDLCVFLYESSLLPRRAAPFDRPASANSLMLASDPRLSDNARYRCRARYMTRDTRVTVIYVRGHGDGHRRPNSTGPRDVVLTRSWGDNR